MTKEVCKKTIVEMLENIEDTKQLERIYRLTKFIYVHKNDIQQTEKPI